MHDWLKNNAFNVIYLVASTVAIYMALNDRVLVLEQQVLANVSERQNMLVLMDDLKEDIKDLKGDINTLDNKTDEMIRLIGQLEGIAQSTR